MDGLASQLCLPNLSLNCSRENPDGLWSYTTWFACALPTRIDFWPCLKKTSGRHAMSQWSRHTGEVTTTWIHLLRSLRRWALISDYGAGAVQLELLAVRRSLFARNLSGIFCGTHTAQQETTRIARYNDSTRVQMNCFCQYLSDAIFMELQVSRYSNQPSSQGRSPFPTPFFHLLTLRKASRCRTLSPSAPTNTNSLR